MYATVIDKCLRITSPGSEEVPDLQCHQEEADGHLLLHAAHAAGEGYQAVVICSEETCFYHVCGIPRKDRGSIVPEMWHKNTDTGC